MRTARCAKVAKQRARDTTEGHVGNQIRRDKGSPFFCFLSFERLEEKPQETGEESEREEYRAEKDERGPVCRCSAPGVIEKWLSQPFSQEILD